jgi:16S rRNA (guanine1516-N2)-methyltransferase
MTKPLVRAESPIWQSKAQLLSEALGLGYADAGSRNEAGLILVVGERLHLENKKGLTFEIDFDEDHIHYRQKQIGKKNLLARALGIEKGINQVVDLSCGLARDAVLLAQLGFQVKAYERCAVLWSMLIEAQKFSTRPEVQGIKFINDNSLDAISRLSQAERHNQSFYFDPMFPETKKEALPKKEMQIFRELVGLDLDSVEVVRRSFEMKISRLVVKRPPQATPLFRDPRYCLEGNLIRYDVYQF